MSRKLLYLLVITAVLLVAGYVFLRMKLQSGVTADEVQKVDSLGGKKVSVLDLRPVFIERMQQLLNQSSNNLYQLKVGDMQVDVLASSIVLSNVKMQPDAIRFDSLKRVNALPTDVYTISFDSLQIKGINLDDAVTSQTMDYESIRLIKPVINIHHKKGKAEKKEIDNEEFSQRFLKQMQKLSVGKLEIQDGQIIVYNDGAKTPSNKLNGVSVELNEVLLDSATRNDKDRFLFAKEGRLSFNDFIKPSKDGLYQLRIGEGTIQSDQKKVILHSFSFSSPLSKKEFTSRQTLSKELYNLSLPSITITNVDWWALLNEEEIIADEVKGQGGKLSIYLNRTLPPKNKMGNFPNQLVKKMPVKLNIKKLSLQNLNFSYEEYSPVSQQNGTVFFDDVNLNVANISNIEVKPMTVNGTALFMHKVPIQAQFVFDMKAAQSGKFTTQVKAAGFDATLINGFAPAMGLMKIEKGTIREMEASINGNQWNANGDVLIAYKDLKLALMEKDKGEKALDKKGFTSFVANLLLLKKDNDSNPPRKASASFKRIPEGGFFMLIWKTMLVGILKTIGAPEKIAYKTVVVPKSK